MRIYAHELSTDNVLLHPDDEDGGYRRVIIEGFADASIDSGWFEVLGYFDDNGDDFCERYETSDAVVVE
jgi:hypothetical protein